MAAKGWSALRNRAERGPSANYLRLKDGESARVRFLVKKEEDAVFFRQHYINNKYRLCEDVTEDGSGECQYCDDDNRPAECYAFNVLDRKDGKVKVLQLAIGHATAILEFYDEYESISDRDYKISRHGNQSQTRYTFVPMKVAKWDAVEIQAYKDRINLDELYDPEIRNPKKETPKKSKVTDEVASSKSSRIKSKARKVEEEDDEEEEEEEEPPKKKAAVKTSPAKKKPAPKEEDDEEEEEEDEDEEDEEDEELEDEEDEDDEDEDYDLEDDEDDE